jgi:hypothetical protein
MDANIVPECYVDTLLAETIAPPEKGYNHQHSCTKVLSVMENKLANEFALGIIDDDKVAPKSFTQLFMAVKRYNNDLALYKHSSKPHYIIKVIPAAENFILNAAQQCSISPADYGLPTELKKFAAITKSRTAKSNANLKQLFLAIKRSNNAGNFCKLAQWIEHLKGNPYASQISLL